MGKRIDRKTKYDKDEPRVERGEKESRFSAEEGAAPEVPKKGLRETDKKSEIDLNWFRVGDGDRNTSVYRCFETLIRYNWSRSFRANE
jgi:hypothetical protein